MGNNNWISVNRKLIEKIKLDYERLCNEYVKLFSEKQEVEFDFWIADEIGGIASFATQYFLNLSDIIFDLNNDCPKWQILRWHDDNVDYGTIINYYSYSKGLRHSEL